MIDVTNCTCSSQHDLYCLIKCHLRTDIDVGLRPLEDRCQPSNAIDIPAKDLLYGVDAPLLPYSETTRPQQRREGATKDHHICTPCTEPGSQKRGDIEREALTNALLLENPWIIIKSSALRQDFGASVDPEKRLSPMQTPA